ncbi:MAG: hypothetical protein FD125_850 [bacterium]|nr:MAG: hypothetical protein FD125_850 [bacterium]
MTCSGPVPAHALALPDTVRAEASLYNTAKRGYDKAKTHSNDRPSAKGAHDGCLAKDSRDARATGVFQSRREPGFRGAVSLTGLASGVLLLVIAIYHRELKGRTCAECRAKQAL